MSSVCFQFVLQPMPQDGRAMQLSQVPAGWVHPMNQYMMPAMPGVVHSASQSPQGAKPTDPESTFISQIVAAVESLYDDEIRPYGRILRKRLAEQAAETTGETEEVDPRELRQACSSCPLFAVEEVEGSDWAVALVDRRTSFLDFYSPEDPYPQSLWDELAQFCSSPSRVDMVMPGGRYSAAKELSKMGLSCLKGYSVGRMCHIVQLAINKWKLLGYTNGMLVPYSQSRCMQKERQAVQKQVGTACANSRIPVAGWDVLEKCLRELSQELKDGNQYVPLSNIKRMFRTRFQVELSETALGYAKVSELLQDSRFHDVCQVKLQGNGYVMQAVVKKTEITLKSVKSEKNLDKWHRGINCARPPGHFHGQNAGIPFSAVPPVAINTGTWHCNSPPVPSAPSFCYQAAHCRDGRQKSADSEADRQSPQNVSPTALRVPQNASPTAPLPVLVVGMVDPKTMLPVAVAQTCPFPQHPEPLNWTPQTQSDGFCWSGWGAPPRVY